jgi:hypothetical protein
VAEAGARGGSTSPASTANGRSSVDHLGNGGKTNGRRPGNGQDGRASAVGGQPVRASAVGGQPVLGQPVGRRHDPRIDPPTKADKRRLWKWGALLAFCPICLSVVVWAALEMNGGYPTVKPPVPAGWQAVPGIYASFSVPAGWSLKQFLSDSNGDIYYSGSGEGVGESVTQADHAPSANGPLPEIVGTFLGWKYQVSSVSETKLANATVAWRYRFHLANGVSSVAVRAWVKPTQSEVWLVASRDSNTTEKALSTLTLAS